MGKYEVLQPVSYVHEDAAVHQTDREVGTVIDLDDAQAAPLVESGALAAHNPTADNFPPGAVVEQPPEQPVEAEVNEDARRGRRRADDDQSA